MDAHPRRIAELIASPGSRFVVPVFQRTYSWDRENCAQLWEDIVAAGRSNSLPHFTGSVLWMQQGTMSASGVTPLMIIDGQQRITTITLLFIALARFAKSHPQPEGKLSFSFDEIWDRGYLVDKYKTGEDHYKLLLSQDDRETLKSLEDNLENEDIKVVEDSARLLDNLAFFEGRIQDIDDVNVVWRGLLLLEVVSISLTQGQDNPQLIFESMNSTGKDLSSADLIRNYVLMGHPKQDELYLHYWRPIELALGVSTYDTGFDDFVGDWLAVVNAPEPLVRRDIYRLFKRYYESHDYDREVPVENLLKELQRFAGYYARIEGAASDDPEVDKLLSHIRQLDISVVNPLLMAMFNDYDHEAFDRDGLISLLTTIESYLFRRTVCDCPTNSLQKFFSSLIARLSRVHSRKGNYVEAFQAYLLGESDTPRRFPTDAEFLDKLQNRDAYHFRRSLYLLSRLENSYHPKDERDFSKGTYTIEHIMPQNALAHKEWKDMLGDVDEEEFEHLLHNLGNLTLTAYNSELSDGTFQQKKERAIGGYNNEYISISSDLHDAEEWTPESIESRCDELLERAAEIWAIPVLSAETVDSYRPKPKSSSNVKEITFKNLFDAGLVKEGDKIVSAHPRWSGSATVTAKGTILLSDGEEFTSPSPAAKRMLMLQGATMYSINGWFYLREGEQGPRLSELRSELEGKPVEDANSRFHADYWNGLYEICAESQPFIDAFGNPAEKSRNTKWWTSFSVGLGEYHFECRLGKRDHYADVGIYFNEGVGYSEMYGHREEIEKALDTESLQFIWSDPQGATKHKALWLRRNFDYDKRSWYEAQVWMRDKLLSLYKVVQQIDNR